MNKKDLEVSALEAAKGIKTQENLADLQEILTKVTVEAALNAELDDHKVLLSLQNLRVKA